MAALTLSLGHDIADVLVHHKGVLIVSPVANKACCSGLHEGRRNTTSALGRHLKPKGPKEHTAAGAPEEELPSEVAVVARGFSYSALVILWKSDGARVNHPDTGELGPVTDGLLGIFHTQAKNGVVDGDR